MTACWYQSGSVIRRLRAASDALDRSRRSGPTGPGPSTHRNAVDREVSEAFVYLLELRGGRSQVFKVGRATDVDQHMKDLNHGLVPEVTGFRWQRVRRLSFPDERTAHAFEQSLHDPLRRHVVKGQTEIYAVRAGEIDTEWFNVMRGGTWSS